MFQLGEVDELDRLELAVPADAARIAASQLDVGQLLAVVDHAADWGGAITEGSQPSVDQFTARALAVASPYPDLALVAAVVAARLPNEFVEASAFTDQVCARLLTDLVRQLSPDRAHTSWRARVQLATATATPEQLGVLRQLLPHLGAVLPSRDHLPLQGTSVTVDRTYAIDWSRCDDHARSVIASAYRRGPGWQGSDASLVWVGDSPGSPRLTGTIEPTGLRIAGAISRLDLERWHTMFLASTLDVPLTH